MNVQPQITLDARDSSSILAALESRRPGYLPLWRPNGNDVATALSAMVAGWAEAIIIRLNQAPDKNKLAFLDLLGMQLQPARPARVPIVFQLASGAASAQALAGTAVAAPPPPGSNQPLRFETQQDCGVMAGKLTQVFSLWPARDDYIDHSAAYTAGTPFTLFDLRSLITLPHHLYLQHSKLLNLSGNVELQIEFQFVQTATKSLGMLWEYWDGQIWRGFLSLDQQCNTQTTVTADGTDGFSANGAIQLEADGAQSAALTLSGISGSWIRARLSKPLLRTSGLQLPAIDSIRISSIVTHAFVPSLKCVVTAAPQPQLLRAKTGSVSAAAVLLGNPNGQTLYVSGTLVNDSGQPLSGATVQVSAGSNSGGVFTQVTDTSGSFELTLPAFTPDQQLTAEVTFEGLDATCSPFVLPSTYTAMTLTFSVIGVAPDKAYNDAAKLDVTKPFYPFGQQPQPGTAFYFTNAEIFSKPGAHFRIYAPRTSASTDQTTPPANGSTIQPLQHLINWEYWNGRSWSLLAQSTSSPASYDLNQTEVLEFTVPVDMEPFTLSSQPPALMMRARLVSGGFGFVQTLSFQTGGHTTSFNVVVTQPPVLASFVFDYTWQYGPFYPENVLTYNDFTYTDHSSDAVWPGYSFRPFEYTTDTTPALYLGFDASPPEASNGLFFNIEEDPSDESGPPLIWEYWNGSQWQHASVTDGTQNLRLPEIVDFIGEDDSAPLPRFGTNAYWLRGRLKEDGPPGSPTVDAIYTNAVWASQLGTYQNVLLGQSNGAPNQTFQITQIPILEGERIEVCEASAPRAASEWRVIVLDVFQGDQDFIRQFEQLLAQESPQTDFQIGDVHLRRDKQRQVSEVWVRWQAETNPFAVGPNDRAYAIDRSQGLVLFNARLLPPGASVSAANFQAGGGTQGNVAAQTINQLLGAVAGVQSVSNPIPAEGGSDRETIEEFKLRAPGSLRHRGRAVTAEDYEIMAQEASSAVRVVKALPNRNPAGITWPGWITLLIIPESGDPQPFPSYGMREEVQSYIAQRALDTLTASTRIFVTGPTYTQVGVNAILVPDDPSQAGPVEAAARAALQQFLHPLYGGLSGTGWAFGRPVYLSDVAVVLHSVPDLDHAESVGLTVNGQLVGSVAPVSPDQIVAAGTIDLKVKAS